MSEPGSGAPIEPGDSTPGVSPMTWLVLRTVLLVISIVLLFPQLLDGLTHGALSRTLLGLGIWRWVAWGTCFVAMIVVRFAGAPKRT